MILKASFCFLSARDLHLGKADKRVKVVVDYAAFISHPSFTEMERSTYTEIIKYIW